MKVVKETEKAINIEAIIECYDVEKEFGWHFWIPKSAINNDGIIADWLLRKLPAELLSKRNVSGGFHILIDEKNNVDRGGLIVDFTGVKK